MLYSGSGRRYLDWIFRPVLVLGCGVWVLEGVESSSSSFSPRFLSFSLRDVRTLTAWSSLALILTGVLCGILGFWNDREEGAGGREENENSGLVSSTGFGSAGTHLFLFLAVSAFLLFFFSLFRSRYCSCFCSRFYFSFYFLSLLFQLPLFTCSFILSLFAPLYIQPTQHFRHPQIQEKI